MTIIFTKHALQRIEERYFKKELVTHTVQYPETAKAGKQRGTMEYMKRFDEKTVTVIVAKTEKGEQLVLSCWIDPPHPSSSDYRKRQRYHAYQKASFWGRVWLDIKSIFGL